MPSRVVNKPKPGDGRYVTKWIGKRRILPLEPYPEFDEDGTTLVEKSLCFSGVLQIYITGRKWVDMYWKLHVDQGE